MGEEITISDFSKVELKVGKILKVKEHENADKLFVLEVDLGEEKPRTVCAGLRGHYKVEELEGKKAIFVANLKPANLRGVESNGMILATVSGDKKKVSILRVDENVEVGSKIS